MDVSIVIVNYKTPILLRDCVKSILDYSNGFDFEIIVVDNHSEDESKTLVTSMFPVVRWIEAGSNVGFGTANNIGIKEANGEHVLLLNSDTELYENSIIESLKHYKEISKSNKIGLLGCKIEHRNKDLQPSCNYYWAGIKEELQANPIVIFIFQRLLKLKKLRDINKYERLSTNHEITWLGVPFALVETKLIKDNLFDENFFMYSEDEELNYRLFKRGYKPFFYSGTGIYHIIGGSSGDTFKRDRQIFASKLLFILKTKGKLYFWVYSLILRINMNFDNRLNSVDEDLVTKNNLKLSWLRNYSKVIFSKKFKVLNTYLD